MNRIGRAHLLVATGAFLVLGSRAALGDVVTAAELESSLREQLESREFANVAVQAENWIAQSETVDSRYDIVLAQPLVLLGDARMGLNDPVGALEAYDRAKHLVRLSDGIQVPSSWTSCTGKLPRSRRSASGPKPINVTNSPTTSAAVPLARTTAAT